MQLVRAFPNPSSNAGLKSENDLHFGERVSIFLDWALLRLQTARSDAPLASVRIALLTAGNEKPWQAGIVRWDDDLLLADATKRRSMLDDLQSRVAKLIHWWHEAQRRPNWYFARTSWKAVSPSKKIIDASAEPSQVVAVDAVDLQVIQQAWSGFKNSGERDYEPGYNRLLAGDVAFDADSPELKELLEFANDLHDAISFDASVHS